MSLGPLVVEPPFTRTLTDLQKNMSENNENDEKMARELVEAYERIKEQVHQVIVGQDAVLEQLLIAMLARGHCLLEGVPGLAKTLMIRSLAQAIDLGFRRIQFTPDLMPADITGTDIIQEDKQSGHRELIFEKGPIFSQIILADEINRTPPKTQAALLEAMQEHSVTIGGKTYDLDQPFFVLATQNPIEQEGTYPLPEAQRDRFIFQVLVEYPSREEERDIIKQTTSTFESKLKPVIDGPTLLRCQETVRKVPVPDHVYDFILDLVRMARPKEDQAADWVKDLIDWGPGPRACQGAGSSERPFRRQSGGRQGTGPSGSTAQDCSDLQCGGGRDHR